MREFGYHGKLYAFSGVISPVVLNAAGDAANGILFTGTTFNPRNPRIKAEETFVQRYKQKFNKLPDHYAGYGYDTGILLTQILKENVLTPEQIKDKLLSISEFSGVFGKSTIDKSGDFHFDVKVYEVLPNGEAELVQ